MMTIADGQLVEGTVVRIDRDEVLLDIGYKSEGVIPVRELSNTRPVADPMDAVAMGDVVEALVITKEDKDGRLVLSKKRAQARACVGQYQAVLQIGRTRERPGHRSRQRGIDRGHRPARLHAGFTGRAAAGARTPALHRAGDQG